MKEILFRGKRDYDNEWVYGNLVIDRYNNPHIVPNEYFIEDGHHLRYEDETDKPVFFKSETIGQLTGLYDKNDVMIFENDIVKLPLSKENCKVVFKNGGFVAEYESNGLRINNSLNTDVEVIGNIHDNPELLK